MTPASSRTGKWLRALGVGVTLSVAFGISFGGVAEALTEAEFKALHSLAAAESTPPRGEEVALGGGRAYLSLPEAASPPLPAVVVIHEWWGLNDHIKRWSDRLAAEGYATLAVDLYGGRVATNRDDASRLTKAVDPAVALATLRAAHERLATDERVRANRRGVLGWCFGGKWSLRHAMSTPGLDAAVIYYGQLESDPEKLASITAPLLGIFANRDASITPAVVDEFEKALERAGVRHEILRYDAEHAFANPSSARYDAISAADAWTHVRAFLEEHLKRSR